MSGYLKIVPSPVAVITGAARGIGLEISHQLARSGCEVWMADLSEVTLGQAVKKLIEEGMRVRAVPLDVTDGKSVRESSKLVGEVSGVLDILVNCAGVLLEVEDGPGDAKVGLAPSTLDLEIFRRTHETNVVGPIRMIQAFLPLLRKSGAGRIVNVSSLLGSLTVRTEPDSELLEYNSLAYSSSKSALNAVTVSFGTELRHTAIKVNSACPGHCQTKISNFTGPRTAQRGAIAPLRLATLDVDGPTCGFFNEAGELPW